MRTGAGVGKGRHEKSCSSSHKSYGSVSKRRRSLDKRTSWEDDIMFHAKRFCKAHKRTLSKPPSESQWSPVTAGPGRERSAGASSIGVKSRSDFIRNTGQKGKSSKKRIRYANNNGHSDVAGTGDNSVIHNDHDNNGNNNNGYDDESDTDNLSNESEEEDEVE